MFIPGGGVGYLGWLSQAWFCALLLFFLVYMYGSTGVGNLECVDPWVVVVVVGGAGYLGYLIQT